MLDQEHSHHIEAAGQQAVAARYGDVLAATNFNIWPDILRQVAGPPGGRKPHWQRIGLDRNELLFILFALAYYRGRRQWPVINVVEMASALALTERQTQNIKTALIEDGYAHRIVRSDPATGRRWPDALDFSPLLALLEACAYLYHGEAISLAMQPLWQTNGPRRTSLDPDAFGQARQERVAARRAARARRAASSGAEVIHSQGEAGCTAEGAAGFTHEGEAGFTPGGEAGFTDPGAAGFAGPESADQNPPAEPVTLRPQAPDHSASREVAAVRPGQTHSRGGIQERHLSDSDALLDAAVVAQEHGNGVYHPPTPEDLASVRGKLEAAIARRIAERGADDRGGGWRVPVAYDDGIWAYLEAWCEEFGDNDPARTLEVVHHLWWNADVPRSAMHTAMKAAYYSTRRLHELGRLGRPMAYLLTALKTALVDQQVLLGRPLPGTPARSLEADGGLHCQAV